MRGICGVLIFATAWLWAEEELPDAEGILIQRAIERIYAAKSVRLECRMDGTTELRGFVSRSEISISVVSVRGANDFERQTRLEVNVVDGGTKEHRIQLPGMDYRSDADGKRLDCYRNKTPRDYFSEMLVLRNWPWYTGIQFFKFRKRPLPEKVVEGVACVGFAGETEAYTAYYGKDDGIPRLVEFRNGESVGRIRLTRVEFDAPIDPGVFTMQPPPGTAIYKEVKPLPKPPPPPSSKPTPRQTGEAIKLERVLSVDSPFPEEKAPVPERVIRGEDF